MGRVYCLEPDKAKGERSGRGCKVTTERGTRFVGGIVRVELDADADEGMATVTANGVMKDEKGFWVIDPLNNTAGQVTFRAWVKVWQPGQDVVPTPDMKLWMNGEGGVIAMPDKFPAVPFERG